MATISCHDCIPLSFELGRIDCLACDGEARETWVMEPPTWANIGSDAVLSGAATGSEFNVYAFLRAF